MTKKEIARLNDLENRASNCEPLTSEEIQERNELEFKRNKENVNMRLTGYDKYYYAYQCRTFTQYVLKSGFNQYLADNIKSISINYCSHYGASIKARLSSGGETNLKTYNDKKDLLCFIEGFNEANCQPLR